MIEAQTERLIAEARLGNVIVELDAMDAVLLEGVLAVLEHDTRSAADRKEAQGDAESATHIGNRALRWRRVRVALEKACYPAKDRRLSGRSGLDSPAGAGESVEASRG